MHGAKMPLLLAVPLEQFHPDWSGRTRCHCEERSDEAISRPVNHSAAYRAGDCFIAPLLAMTLEAPVAYVEVLAAW
jgi:hypothetical protein